jgi:uncharacterized membrane protein YdjX (TVP38/TMEM64 family)
MTPGQRLTLGAAAAVIAGLLAVFLIAGGPIVHYFRHPDELRELVQSWGAWAPLGIILFQMLQVIVAPLPGNAMSFAAGYAFGVWPTLVWLMAGILLGATVDFLLVRLVGRRVLRFFLSEERLAGLDARFLRRGTIYVFLLLLIPNPVGDWVYYLAGLTPIPVWLFLALVFVARLPSNLLECSMGAQATHFGWREWAVLGLAVAILALVYYQLRERIGRWLEHLSEQHEARRKGRASQATKPPASA